MQNGENCHSECLKKRNDVCCESDCFNKENEIYKSGKFHKENIIQAYQSNLLMDYTKEKDLMALIRNSFEVCDKLSKILVSFLNLIFTFFPKVPQPSNMSKLTKHCTTPDFVFSIESCALKRILLGYPSLDFPKHCEDVKKFLQAHQTCGKKIGDTFVIDNSFWSTRDYFSVRIIMVLKVVRMLYFFFIFQDK
jgi:hypothetical protein